MDTEFFENKNYRDKTSRSTFNIIHLKFVSENFLNTPRINILTLTSGIYDMIYECITILNY